MQAKHGIDVTSSTGLFVRQNMQAIHYAHQADGRLVPIITSHKKRGYSFKIKTLLLDKKPWLERSLNEGKMKATKFTNIAKHYQVPV